MRALLLLVLAIGCGSSEEEEVEAPEAPEGPVGGGTPRAQLDRVKVSTDLSAIRAGIKMYKNDHEGENPPSLAILKVSGLYYADHYEYDAASGTVRCPEIPNL